MTTIIYEKGAPPGQPELPPEYAMFGSDLPNIGSPKPRRPSSSVERPGKGLDFIG